MGAEIRIFKPSGICVCNTTLPYNLINIGDWMNSGIVRIIRLIVAIIFAYIGWLIVKEREQRKKKESENSEKWINL